MNARLAVLIAVIVGSCSSLHAKDDKKVIYVGDGRYTCQGRDCGEFRARERQYQDARERERQRDNEIREYEWERRSRDREYDRWAD